MFLSRKVRLLFLSACVSTFAGCSFFFGVDGLFPDKSNDYLKAEESSPLAVPDSLDTTALEDAYPIPELEFSNVLPKKYEVPRVSALEDIESKGTVVIQTFKQDQWVLIKRSPAQTWPLVLQFLQSNQIPLTRVHAEVGVIETGWLTVAGNETDVKPSVRPSKVRQLPQERYQFVLKQGVQRLTTEVIVKQLQKEAPTPPTPLWPTSSDWDRQSNMVTLLAEHLAGSPDQSSHSLLAQGIGSASKVSMQYASSGTPFIKLQLPYDRGWAALQLALPKAGFAVKDIDRSQGLFYTRFEGRKKPEKKPGVFKRVFRTLTFYNARKKDRPEEAYQISVAEKNNSLYIGIARDSKPALEPNEQAFLLRKILNKIS